MRFAIEERTLDRGEEGGLRCSVAIRENDRVFMGVSYYNTQGIRPELLQSDSSIWTCQSGGATSIRQEIRPIQQETSRLMKDPTNSRKKSC